MTSRTVLILWLATIISGCAAVPEKLSVNEDVKLLSFADARGLANEVKGESVRWGGVIAKVETLPTSTMIEVVSMPLSSSTRPRIVNNTEGRFRIYANGLLDPLIFKKGKHVTVVGLSGGIEAGNIGKLKYQYPVVEADYVHLWKEVTKPDYFVNQPHWHLPYYWNYHSPRYFKRRVGFPHYSSKGTQDKKRKKHTKSTLENDK